MRIMVIGGGGREHALVWALSRSAGVETVIACPGNPGTAPYGAQMHIDISDAAAVLSGCQREGIDLVVVGPEVPLVDGLADALRCGGMDVFGPSAAAALLEGSKAESKRFMATHGIPTAEFGVFDDPEAAREFVASSGRGWVVKADGLAAGKGVIVADNVEETMKAIDHLMVGGAFGEAGRRVVVEERLAGPELSVMVVCDGERWFRLPTSRDHKRIGDGDTGPNTGGMGAFAPVPDADDALLEMIDSDVIGPTVRGLAAEGRPFIGCLYTGFMLTPEGPKVLEYNVRFGDPETQVLLPLLKGDVAGFFRSAARGALEPGLVEIRDGAAATVVIASAGYPVSSTSGLALAGLPNAESIDGVTVFHAGTARDEGGRLVSAGGRVLAVTGVGNDLSEALDRAYRGVAHISMDGQQFRTDIGRSAITV